MAKRVKALVSPDILRWARTSAGYSIDDVATRLKKPVDVIDSIESGNSDYSLTIGQIRNLADFYRLPLSDFFLPNPRKERALPHDFRSQDGGHSGYNPKLIKEMRRASARRDHAMSLNEDLQEEIPAISAKINKKMNPDEAGNLIRELCSVDIEQQKKWGDGVSGYKKWRTRLGNIGCLVFQFDTLPIDQVLGFSLTERPLPVIAVNVKMKHNGRTFTMLHEFVHVLLQKSAVCDLEEFNQQRREDRNTEKFCNASAAAALMPKEDFLAHPIFSSQTGLSDEWSDREISEGAHFFDASREAFVRRMLTLKKTSKEFYVHKRKQYIAERASQRNKEKEKNKDKPIIRSYSKRAISNLDQPFVKTVLRGYHNKYMTMVDAARLLDVRPEKVLDVEKHLMGVSL